MSIKIIPVQEHDIEEIATFMAKSFAEDPLYTFFAPEKEQRMEFMRDFFAFRIRFAMHLGRAFTTEDKKAVAAWIPPDVHMLPEHLMQYGGMQALQKAGDACAGRLMGYSDFAGKIEAEFAPAPHWHLSPIAVDPDFQGKGYARALLTNMCTYFDETQQFCYLDTQTEKNKTIYEKYGFVTVKQDVLPGTDKPHFGMLRNPLK